MAAGDSPFASGVANGAVGNSPFVDEDATDAGARPQEAQFNPGGTTQRSPFMGESAAVAAESPAPPEAEVRSTQIETFERVAGLSPEDAAKVVDFLHEDDNVERLSAAMLNGDEDIRYVARAVLSHLAAMDPAESQAVANTTGNDAEAPITEVVDPGTLTEVVNDGDISEDKSGAEIENEQVNAPVAEDNSADISNAPELHPAIAEAFSAAGADESELAKIHGLIAQEVADIEARVHEAIDSGEEAVTAELAKLREEFGFGQPEAPTA
jgi:hypothetical protein